MKRLAFITNIILFSLTFAQNTSYKFDYYDISNGLSQNRAQVIYQANDGYIYVGSQGGLDRFDGYKFDYFSHNPSDTSSIPFGWVSAISEDSKQNLWIGTTQKNIGYLDSKGKWTRVKLKGMENWDRDGRAWWWGFISDIKYLNDEVFISSNGNGLFVIKNGVEKHYTSQVKEENVISEIKIINDRIFVATRGGMLELDTTEESFKKTAVSSPVFGFSKTIGSNKFYVSGDKNIFLFDNESKSQKVININSDANERAYRRISLHNDKLWILNESYGITIYDTINMSSVDLSPPSIKDTEHFGIIVDRDNAVWIGTSSYGMMKFDPGKQKFKLYSKNFPTSNPLNFDVAWGANIDKNGNYWTGKAESNTEIIKIDRKTGAVKRYLQTSDPKSWFYNFVNTKNGMLVWKGFPGRPKTYWLKYNYNSDRFTETDYFTLFPDSVRGSWGHAPNGETFALTTRGIKIFNGTSFVIDKKLSSFFEDNKYPFEYTIQGDIVYLYEGSESQLFKWDTKKNEILPFAKSELFRQQGYQSTIVYNDTLIYLTTYGFGLAEINTNSNEKKFYTVSDGLPSQHLYEGFLGKDNKIWVSSNYGIISFDPKKKGYKSYLVADGLQDYEFNGNSSFHSQDGEMMFVGIRGLNYFYPKDIIPKSNPPQVIIQKAVVGEESMDLNEGFVDIPWYDNKVVFDFVALSYRNPTKNQYSYFMDGYESDWIYSDNRRFATYTNLPAGQYTFKVKGSNNDGIWNEEGASIGVKVYPPPWKTWWAYLIYIFSILATGYAYTKQREKAQLKQMEDERKQSELDAAKDLQESMLPKTTPENKNFSIETFIRSSTEVGGDYYDFFAQEDGSFYSVCGDATGHGTTAGMMVSITKAGLNGIPSLPPNEILNRLNKVVKRVDLGIIRMSLNVVHFKNGTASMANAAMPPIYHYSAKSKKLKEIEIVNLPLGGLSNEEYELIEIKFHKGDLLIQLSDGLPEAPNPSGDLIDYDRLFDCIEQNAMKSPKDVVESLVDLAENWLDGNINPDDITIVATKKV
jgi:serine phosphatase RsbU (regulator of sigma subunit)/streptogramin lyase